jgi:hypothetical protein
MNQVRRILPILVVGLVCLNLLVCGLLVTQLGLLDRGLALVGDRPEAAVKAGTRPSGEPALAEAAPTSPPLDLPSAIPSNTPASVLPGTEEPAQAPPTSTLRPTPTLIPVAITETIGVSAGGRPIVSYQFKNGPNKIVFVGGIHGGYEWNSILLAYEAIDHFRRRLDEIPDSATLYIIPSANPDGQYAVTGLEGRFKPGDVISDTVPGRFNDNSVDLNRNWDCLWEPQGLWRERIVDAGSEPFSEPETVALRDFLLAQQPAAVVFWHSQADGVYGSGCGDVFLPALELAHVYGQAAGYVVHESFDEYAISGDSGDWLATQAIPAVTVELSTHEHTEFGQNLAGMLAVLAQFGAGGSGAGMGTSMP